VEWNKPSVTWQKHCSEKIFSLLIVIESYVILINHRVCKPAIPALFGACPSQDKLGGLQQKCIQHKNGGMVEVRRQSG